MANGAKALSDEFLECRIHHAWEIVRDPSVIPNRPHAIHWANELWSKCARCGTMRLIRFNMLGHRVSGGVYLYPDGYSLSQDESPTKDQVRAEVVKRIMPPEMRYPTARPKRKTRR